VIKPSEAQILLLAIAVTPLIAWMYRGIEWREKRWLAWSLIALLGAYIATVVEGFVAEAFFNSVEHILFVVSAACFVVASTGFLRTKPAEQPGRRS
jgi:drug/metabolite transporter (DMT)-like permease